MGKIFETEFIKNIAICGAPGVGKTTLAEAMLFTANQIPQMGNTAKGTTVMDFDEEEITKKMSLKTTLAFLEWKNYKINIIDLPGIPDLIFEIKSAVNFVEGLIFTISAVDGITIDTERNWNIIKEFSIPKIIFLNKMDGENINFDKIIEDGTKKFKKSVIPLIFPIGTGKDFKGFVDIINLKAFLFDKNSLKETEIPANLKETVEKYRSNLMEIAAETKDELIEKFLNGEQLSEEEFKTGLKICILNNKLIPLLCGSAINNLGIQLLLDSVLSYVPSPFEIIEKEGFLPSNPEQKIKRKCSVSEPFSGIIFKTRIDPFAGKISYCKIISGVLEAGKEVYNSNKNLKEKPAHLWLAVGKNFKEITSLKAGDIVTFTKQENLETGTTLSDPGNPVVYEPLKPPKPSYFVAIQTNDRKSSDKLSEVFHNIAIEDPSFNYSYNDITKEVVVSCVGETQARIIFDLIKHRYKLDFNTRVPRVSYKETITAKAEGHYKHKKQSGGHGQYGEVYLRIEPLKRNDGFVFTEEIFGGAIPKNYIPAIEKGTIEACQSGAVAGYPVVDLKVTVYDGTYHEVDSSDLSFRIAGLHAMKLAIEAAKPVILEPIAKVQIYVEENDIGSIMSDISSRRGKVLKMDKFSDDYTVINAYVPYSEMLTYLSALNSMTKGKGFFEMEFSHYDYLPFNEYDKAKKQAEEIKKEAEAQKD